MNSAVPIGSLKKITRTLHDSISRVATGLRVLGGNDAASQSLANSLSASAASFKAAESNAGSGITLLELAESALLELNSLATRLKEVGVADTKTTNTAADTAALNSEAIYLSDTIDSVVSSLTYNGVNVLGTSARTYNVAIDDSGNTQQIKLYRSKTNLFHRNSVNNSWFKLPFKNCLYRSSIKYSWRS